METAVGWIIALALGAHSTFTKLDDMAHPVDDNRWIIEVLELPRKENSFQGFAALAEAEHDWTDLTESRNKLTESADQSGIRLKKLDFEKLDASRKEFAQVFRKTDRMVEKRQYCPEPFRLSGPDGPSQGKIHARSILAYADYLNLTALHAIRTNRHDAFLRDWKRSEKLSSELYRNNPVTLNFLVGLTMQTRLMPLISLQADKLAGKGDLDSLAKMQERLKDQEPPLQVFRDAMKGEYRFQMEIVNKATLHDLNNLHGEGPHSGKFFAILKLSDTPQFLLNDFKRDIIAFFDSQTSTEEMPEPGKFLQMFEELREDRARSFARSFIEGRFVNFLLLGVTMPAVHPIRQYFEIHRASYRMLQLKIALLRHEIENGGFPSQLQDLVPKYIDSMPIDPFTGEAFQFDPKKRVIYSAGRDREDDGGDFDRPFARKHDADYGLAIGPLSR